MAATKLTPKDFVEALKEWSVLDVVEAVKAIEDEFGIKAAAPVAAAAAPAGGSNQMSTVGAITAAGSHEMSTVGAITAAGSNQKSTVRRLAGPLSPRRPIP